jgi:hydrogenase nickel incorporation protein HypA/HybF
MHEMGIASSILEAVQKEEMLQRGCRATKVGVRIGDYAGVDAESLRFCFEALVKGSSLASLELAIEARAGDELDLCWVEFDDAEAAA